MNFTNQVALITGAAVGIGRATALEIARAGGSLVLLDMNIEKLTELESAGNEDLVNAMLDGTILLINQFAEKGYSLRAMHQIQRFYFLCYDELKDINIGEIASKLEECFTTEGVFEGDFASDIEQLFGFSADTDYSYIFDMEDDE